MAAAINFTPRNFTNPEFRDKAELEPITTFYCFDESGQNLEEIPIHQLLFFADSVSRVPQLLVQTEDDEERYDFRALIGAGARKDVSGLWEAFRSFREWLYNGAYLNTQYAGTHVDAYILGEKLQSPRFQNAVMREILKTMTARKYDTDLKDTYRTLFENCSPTSPLRKLYFESASFWKFGFEEGGYFLRGATGDLGLDPTSDRSLIDALKEHRDVFCRCPLTKVPAIQLYPPPPSEDNKRARRRWFAQHPSNQPKRPPPTLRRTPTTVCNCEKEPWKTRDRFYISC